MFRYGSGGTLGLRVEGAPDFDTAMFGQPSPSPPAMMPWTWQRPVSAGSQTPLLHSTRNGVARDAKTGSELLLSGPVLTQGREGDPVQY